MDKDYGVLPMKSEFGEGVMYLLQFDGRLTDGRSLHRGDLLKLLLRRVPKSSTHLNKKLKTYVEDPRTGVITLQFADGTSATCDVLIGCDGISSKTRGQMMQHENERAGTQEYSRFISPRWSGTIAYRFLTPSAALKAKNPEHSLLNGAQVVSQPQNSSALATRLTGFFTQYFGKGMVRDHPLVSWH